jgi:multiple sugar transport system ATP-binding protein
VGEIVLDNVRKEFGGEVVAVDDVNMTISEGEFMVLVGPSGCEPPDSLSSRKRWITPPPTSTR